MAISYGLARGCEFSDDLLMHMVGNSSIIKQISPDDQETGWFAVDVVVDCVAAVHNQPNVSK
jgi:hypothetical protein